MSIVVDIPTEIYIKCARYAWNCASAKKKGTAYNKGLLNVREDPTKTQRIGKLGEAAFGLVYQLVPDYTYRRYGDSWDFEVRGITIDIKTASTANSDAILIRVREANGHRHLLKSQYYVGARLIADDRFSQTARVELVGKLARSVIQKFPEIPARRGDHWNIEVPFAALIPLKTDKCIIAHEEVK